MRLAIFCAGSALFLAVTGCVGQGAYQKKVDEVAEMGRAIDGLQRINADLASSNDGLRAEISGLQKKVGELEGAKRELEQALSAKDDGSYQRVAELEREKARLAEDLARVHRERDGKVRDVSRGYESLLERMKDAIARGAVQVSELRGRLSIWVPFHELFDSGSAELTSPGMALLGKLGNVLKDFSGNKVTVGAVFPLPKARPESAGQEELPWKLPIARSVAVTRNLVQHGVAAELLVVEVQGEFESADSTGISPKRGKADRIEVSLEIDE